VPGGRSSLTIRVTLETRASVGTVPSAVSIHRSKRSTPFKTTLKGLILAQNERWRCGLGMQVARESLRTSKAADGRVTRNQPAPETGIATGNGG
jgi:hypothetical protein